MSNWKRFVVAFDLHGDEQDQDAVAAFRRFVPKWNPDIKVFGGDLWDFRPLRKGASPDERRESMRSDFEAGLKWLQWYQPQYFIRGNHDERLWELAQNGDGPLSDHAANGVHDITEACRKMRSKMLPYHKRDGILRLGHLKILHGFACGVFSARQTALIYGSCLFGHVHDVTEHSIPGLERRVARSCGCLCNLDMDYAARTPNTLRQAHGWAYGVINERSGDYITWQAECINGVWMIPSDIEQL